MTQNEVRLWLDRYLKDSGVKARYVSKALNLDETLISHFRHGRKDLYKDDLLKLAHYLVEKSVIFR